MSNRVRFVLRAILLVTTWGCLACKAPSAANVPQPEPMVLGPATSTQEATAKAERDVQAVIDAWLAAQNHGQFDAYRALYAAKFQGVRRSGPRVRRFNREGWMVDRKRMFASPMQVSFTPKLVTVTGAIAVVDGTQTWASASYKDTGPKRLLLFRDGGQDAGVGPRSAWKIAREEMLASTMEARPSLAARADRFLPAYGGRLVLASGLAPDEGWFSGPATRDEGDVLRAVDPAKLPPSLGAWKGKTVRVFGKNGQICDARVGAFRVRTTAQWHFATVGSWRDDEVPDAEVIKEILTRGTPLLEAMLEDAKGDCASGVLAFDESQRIPAVTAFEPWKGATLTAAIREAQRQLPRENEMDGGVGFVATLPAPDPTGAKSYRFLVSSTEMCTPESIGVDATFLWKSRTSARGPLVRKTTQGQLVPLLLVDLDDDGDLELVYEEWPSLMVGFADLATGASLPAKVEVPYFDCPC